MEGRRTEIENNFINNFLEKESEDIYEYENIKTSKKNNNNNNNDFNDDFDNITGFTEQITEADTYQSFNPNKFIQSKSVIEIVDTEELTENDTEIDNKEDKFQSYYNHVNIAKENNNNSNMYTEIEREMDHDNEPPNTYTEYEDEKENFVYDGYHNSTEPNNELNTTTTDAYTKTEIQTERITLKEMEIPNNENQRTEIDIETEMEIEMESEIESEMEKNNETYEPTSESKIETESITHKKDTEKINEISEPKSEPKSEPEMETIRENENLPNLETVNTNGALENNNDTMLLDTSIHHEISIDNAINSDIQEIKQKLKIIGMNSEYNVNNYDDINSTTSTISSLNMSTDGQPENQKNKVSLEMEYIDVSKSKTFGGYTDAFANTKLMDSPNELSKVYWEHIKSEEKKYEASTSYADSEGMDEESSHTQKFKSISDMVVIDVINDDENKRINTFITNPDTADVTLTTDNDSDRDRSLKRSYAFYDKLPEKEGEEEEEEEKKLVSSVRTLKPPKSLFNQKLKFRFNHDTYRNYILRRIHSHKQNSIAIASIKNNRKWTDNEQGQASTSSTPNHQNLHEFDLHKKNKFAKRIINKYNLSNFIAKQRYKAKLKIDYYKIMYQRHLNQPKMDFQDYMKEYDNEKYEANPYIQEIYNKTEVGEEEGEEEMTEKEIRRRTEYDHEYFFDEEEEEDRENQNPQKKMKLINNILIKHENHNHRKYENQDIPLLEKRYHPKENYFSKFEKKSEPEKESEKKFDFSYYRKSYDDERNSRNIYLSEDLTKESLKRPQRFNQKEFNKLIFREMQKRNKTHEKYNREKFSEKLHFHLNNKNNNYYHFKSEKYLLESPKDQMEKELREMDLQHKMELQNQTLHPEKLIIDIKDSDDSDNDENEDDEEKKVLLSRTPQPIKKRVSFKMDIVEDEEDEIRHEPLRFVDPLQLKSCLSKEPVDYDKKLFMKDQIEMKKGDNAKSNKGNGSKEPQKKEIIASSIVNEYTSEMNSYIGDDFGNYFTGYAYNNYYYFNGKNYTLRSMFNPKMFYREYFSNENTIRTNDQLFRRYTKLFKMINLYRAIITTLYGVYELYESKPLNKN
ncbi:hypothetical protein PIROE2DRAFT_59035 [Piromyces sp. E2]|nr:hypothetical protein PIROE2DRAFT_59035 [Piromyces sp. E2]|eukprot:OUM67049.1 hypothetical protein PIROE2DRAFT_59035 [Piromyces sp. E2]